MGSQDLVGEFFLKAGFFVEDVFRTF